MPGTNAGTGYPLTLRCGKCKRGRDYRSYRDKDMNKGTNLVRTGEVRALPKSQQGHGGIRALQHQVAYKCLDCRHVGWTRMKDILHKPLMGEGQ